MSAEHRPTTGPIAEDDPPSFAVATLRGWATIAGAAKAVALVVAMALSAVGGAFAVARSAASMRDVDVAERRAVDRATQLVESHAVAGPHVQSLQTAQSHEVRLQALERELDWQATALALIADRLKVRLPPRPKHGGP